MSFAILKEPYTSSGCGCILFLTGRRIKLLVASIIELLSGLGLLGSIERAAAATFLDACRIQFAAYDGIANADVFHATASDKNDRVLLKIMTLAGNIGGNFHAIGQAYTGDFPYGGVWFAGSLCRHTRTNASFERRGEKGWAVFNCIEAARKRDCLRTPSLLGSALACKLIYRRHVYLNIEEQKLLVEVRGV